MRGMREVVFIERVIFGTHGTEVILKRKNAKTAKKPANPFRRDFPCGENHPNAKLTDHEVELVRCMHAHHGMSYREIALLLDVPKSTIRDIVLCRTR